MASMIDGGAGAPNTNGLNGQGNTPQPVGFSRLSKDPNAAAAMQHARSGGNEQKKRRRPLEKKLNLNELVKMLYRGRWIILLTFVVVFAYTVFTTYSKPFIYSSWARMFIEKTPTVTQIKGMGTEDDHSISNQITFFKSHMISQHVAHLLWEYAHGRRGEMDSLFTEYFGSTKAIPTVPSRIDIIKMMDNPKLPPQPGIPDENVLEARAVMAVKIDADAGNDYLIVTTEGYTPEDAAFIANVFVVVYAKDNLSRSRSNAESLKDILAQQKKHSYDTLAGVESQLKNYLREANGLSIEQEVSELTTQLDQTKLKYENLLIDLAERKKIYADLVKNRDTVEKAFYDNLALQPEIQLLQSQIANLQTELLNMQTTNTVMNPRMKQYVATDIKSKSDKIASLTQSLREKEERLINSTVPVITDGSNVGANGDPHMTSVSDQESVHKLRMSIVTNEMKIGQDSLVAAQLAVLISTLQAQIGAMPDKIIESNQLKRSEGSAERLYMQLEDKYMDAWLAEQSVFGSVKLEDPAAFNPTPIRPNRQASILTGALMGLGLGIGVVVLLSFLDTTIRSPDEVESHGLSVLATIPIIQPLAPDPALLAQMNGHMPKFTAHRVAFLDSRSSIAEAYRSLRTSIQFASLDIEIRTIAVTSSVPQEGKSTTSANLAIVMAQMGKRTLLIDTDLRRPTVHSVFGVHREPGLTNILFDKIDFNEAIHDTDVPNLWILTCGIIPPNPAELLGSEKMRALIDTLTEHFDMIIFDTPPVVAVTDALLLGMKVDAMLVVARADATKADALIRSVDTIERSGAHLLGIVLNNFNVANAYGAYYRYYQYYNYYSHDQPLRKTPIQRLLGPIKRKPKKVA